MFMWYRFNDADLTIYTAKYHTKDFFLRATFELFQIHVDGFVPLA